jgi:hypothetical protein
MKHFDTALHPCNNRRWQTAAIPVKRAACTLALVVAPSIDRKRHPSLLVTPDPVASSRHEGRCSRGAGSSSRASASTRVSASPGVL